MMSSKRWAQPLAAMIFLATCWVGTVADAITGDEVLARVDAVMSAPHDGTSTAEMTLIDKNGRKKERRLKVWTRYFKDRDDWSLLKFTSPPEIRDLGFLSLADDKMYLYLPAFDRVRRIASHARKESFAGSDLSNDDLSTGKYADNFSATIREETDREYILELTRKPGSNRIYPRCTAWVNKEHFTIRRMELYGKNGKLWKVLEAEPAEIQGYWTWTALTMTDVRKDHKTIMRMKEIRFDVGLGDEIFTRRFLKRKTKGD